MGMGGGMGPMGPPGGQMGGPMGPMGAPGGMMQGYQGWGAPQQQGYTPQGQWGPPPPSNPPQGYGPPQGPQGYQNWGTPPGPQKTNRCNHNGDHRDMEDHHNNKDMLPLVPVRLWVQLVLVSILGRNQQLIMEPIPVNMEIINRMVMHMVRTEVLVQMEVINMDTHNHHHKDLQIIIITLQTTVALATILVWETTQAAPVHSGVVTTDNHNLKLDSILTEECKKQLWTAFIDFTC